MNAATRQKYIAEGYLEDSSILLNEFVDLSTVEFSEFASLWRKHHFSLIFMGRPDHTETCEFTNEIFRITSQFLFSPSFYQQVGAVYILYALFRNQIAEPSIKIRIEMNHWKVIKSLRDEALLKSYKTLHYVIDYLMDHAFLYVANQTLKGPLIGNMPKSSKHDESICNMKTTYKSDIMKYSILNNLEALRDYKMQYVAEKRKIGSARFNLSEGHEIYEKAFKELHEIVNPSNKKGNNLGDRRAKIKAESFIRKSKGRFGILSDEEVEAEVEEEAVPPPGSEKKSRVRRRPKRRRPKEDRRVGRPKKNVKEEPEEPKSDNDDVDITHLLQQQKDFYLLPVNFERKMRSKRDPYYQTSPKRESNSDTDSSD